MTDAESIQSTIAEYCQLYDDRRFDEFEDIWTENATFGSSTFGSSTRSATHKGRHNIRLQLEKPGTPTRRGIHAAFIPVVKVDGDTAEATADYVWFGVSGGQLELGPGGRYNFSFVKDPDRWRISALYVKVLLTAAENAARRARREHNSP